jgi:surface-anchored protein
VVNRDPEDVVLHATPEARTVVPNDPRYAFLGPEGADVWVLPQTPIPGVLWLGWGAPGVDDDDLIDDTVTWNLTSIDGPGHMAIYTTRSNGSPTVVFNSRDGLPDTTTIPPYAHVHANWAFSAAGQYTVTFEATATLVDGTPVTTGPVPYTFTVDSYSCGDIDDLAVTGGATVEVDYLLTNCGTDTDDYTVDAHVIAPTECGGATETHSLGTHTLDTTASAAGSGSFTSPTCAGTYEVLVEASGPTNSWAEQVTFTVT